MLIGWKPPPTDWVKVYMNSPCKEKERIGCGGVIRGSDVEWLGGFAKYIGRGSAYLGGIVGSV